jgi:hypothetical protein
MYKAVAKQPELENFVTPFGGSLRPDNRWVVFAGLIPWDLVEKIYAASFSSRMGAGSYSSRIAFGALFIRDFLNITDEETIEQIRENPAMQFLLGYLQYRDIQPFDPSLMVSFRKRFGPAGLAAINQHIVLSQTKKNDQSKPEPSQGDGTDQTLPSGKPAPELPPNQGKLIIDATCGPADIRFPTDVSLLNEARENAEALIDHLCCLTGSPAPRTYRQKARWDFLAFIKNKRPRKNKVRRAIKKQLQYIKRDIGYIDLLLQKPVTGDNPLGISGFVRAAEVLEKQKKWQKRLDTLRKVYAQQLELHETGATPSKERIVSFSQPHVRTIVRGKARAPVEFGNKFSLMVVDGYCLPCDLSWNAYNEGGCLQNQIELYRSLLGFYPESVHVDQIYRTQSNRRYCFAHGIRISGKPLGRPKKETDTNRQELREQAKQRRRDEADRVEVEGKFGVAKRAGELGCIRTKLDRTSEATIHLVFLIMNLRKIWRQILCALLRLPLPRFELGRRCFRPDLPLVYGSGRMVARICAWRSSQRRHGILNMGLFQEALLQPEARNHPARSRDRRPGARRPRQQGHRRALGTVAAHRREPPTFRLPEDRCQFAAHAVPDAHVSRPGGLAVRGGLTGIRPYAGMHRRNPPWLPCARPRACSSATCPTTPSTSTSSRTSSYFGLPRSTRACSRS